tara:strand:+ start:6325 stop:7599 length:1275 start_codon:yes stop_codon:yes gene_type:complete
MKPIELAKTLYPINRSLTGEGVRMSLNILKDSLEEIEVKEYKCGEKCFDWQIPPEWNIKEGWIQSMNGENIVDLAQNNLHVMGYSIPINQTISREELLKHVHTSKENENAIPYVTSYYNRDWGFCLTDIQKKVLIDEFYKVYIDSELNANGVLNYGEAVIRGRTKQEVLISTYICHPSMANNEISGPVVATYIGQWLKSLKKRNYTYRLLFLPETIGSIAYISKNLKRMKRNIKAGFVLTCIGDEKNYSYLQSRKGNTLSDRAAQLALQTIDRKYKKYGWNERGSDERQYCAPGVDLPICSIMRTKYNEYPEYHTSLDNFNIVTEEGLQGGIQAVKQTLTIIERNIKPRCRIICEPQLGKRGLYPTKSDKKNYNDVQDILNIISYCDGKNDTIDIANKCKIPFTDVIDYIDRMIDEGIVEKKRF